MAYAKKKNKNLAVKGISNWRLTWVRLPCKLTWFQELKTSPISIPWKKSKLCCNVLISIRLEEPASLSLLCTSSTDNLDSCHSIQPPLHFVQKGAQQKKKTNKTTLRVSFGNTCAFANKNNKSCKRYHLSLFNQFRWFSNTKQVFQNSQQCPFTKSRYLVNCYNGPLFIVLLLMSCFAPHTLRTKFLFIPVFTILCYIWVGVFCLLVFIFFCS